MMILSMFLASMVVLSPPVVEERRIERALEGAPGTVEEGLERLEQLLGEFDPNHAKLWWRRSCRAKPTPSSAEKPELLHIMEDTTTLSAPYRYGEQLAFDRIHRRRAWNYDIDATGRRELTWSQHRHSAVRYLFRRGSSGIWFVQRQMRSHSSPQWVGRTHDSGIVIWTETGLKVVSVGIDYFIQADGKRREAPIYTWHRFERDGDILRTAGSYRYYEFATGPDELPLPIPDFEVALSAAVPLEDREPYRLKGADGFSRLQEEATAEVVHECLTVLE